MDSRWPNSQPISVKFSSLKVSRDPLQALAGPGALARVELTVQVDVNNDVIAGTGEPRQAPLGPVLESRIDCCTLAFLATLPDLWLY